MTDFQAHLMIGFVVLYYLCLRLARPSCCVKK